MVTSLGLDSRVRSLRRVLPLPAPYPLALQSLSPSGWRLCLQELGKLMLAQIWNSLQLGLSQEELRPCFTCASV